MQISLKSLLPLLAAAGLVTPATASADWSALLKKHVVVTKKQGGAIAGKLTFLGSRLLIVRADRGDVIQIDAGDVASVRPRPASEIPPEPPPPAAPPPSPLAPPPQTVTLAKEGRAASKGATLGFRFSPLVAGSITASQGGFSASGDMATAFGFTIFTEYRATPHFSMGFGPQFAFNVAPKGASGDAKEIDLNLRLKFGYPATDRVYPYVLVTPGAAILVNGSSETGLHLGAAGGISFEVGEGAAMFLELGYEWSFFFPRSGDLRLGYFVPQLGFQYLF
jgi:hypothetical protein